MVNVILISQNCLLRYGSSTLECSNQSSERKTLPSNSLSFVSHFGLNAVRKNCNTFIHKKPTGTPSSPARENIALPTSFVICKN